MEILKKLSQLVHGFEGPDVDVVGITADSREVAPGFLFAGLPGSLVDGSTFIDQAIASGATSILTHQGYEMDVPDTVALLKQADPRHDFAEIAAQFYSPQPDVIVAVTGTNGKTSVASFVRQIWMALGIEGASLGTVGVVSSQGVTKLDHTTPDPVTLHKALQELALSGVDHLALEASSHGLAQRRLDGVHIQAAAFTNITRDHLDYHGTFEAYLAEKARLFSELLPDNGIAVIDADTSGAGRIIETCDARMLNLMTVGCNGRYLNLKNLELDGFTQNLTLRHHRGQSQVRLPLVGDFQASNALVAAGLVAAGGIPLLEILPKLSQLRGAKGRLELVGTKKCVKVNVGAPVFIDYAHTPDALQRAIEALIPYKKGRLIVVFGCGGDRDKGKRAQMGRIASELADMAIVTDDNPRNESPDQIRAEIMSGAKKALEIGDRHEAILHGIELLNDGDLLLIAGKGHETGQIIGDEILPFSDHEVVGSVLDLEDCDG